MYLLPLLFQPPTGRKRIRPAGGFVFPPFFAGSSPFFPKRGWKFPRFGGNFSPVSSVQGKGNLRKIPAKNGQKRRKTIQKFRICAAAAALALLCAAPVSAAELPAEEGIRTVNAARQGSFRFDFSRDGEGFSPLIADCPVGSETFYELEVSRQAIPIDGAGCGPRLTGNNHSDDLFLGISRCLEGLPAGLPCVFTVRVRIATNVDGGLIGIGGSPGSSVFVKCGITAAEPRREAVDGSYRLTLDKGNQGQDGPDMAIVGNLEKENGQRPGQYEWKSYRCRAMAVPGQDGKVYLSFGIDSGFEGLSCYYLDSVDIAWEEAQPLSRGAAIQTLWESLGRPTGEAEPFPDTAKDAPYAAALAWARSLGIARGYADGSFRPEESLSRQQALPLLYRATGSPEVFWAPELPGLAAWARDAAAWALDQELLRTRELGAPAGPIPGAVFRQMLPTA